MPLPLYNLDDVLRIHDAALDYAVRVQQAAARQSEQRVANLVAGAALMILAHEMVCLHQAIKPLCFSGWAFAAPILLRTILDATCSALVIVNSERPDVEAFKYLYAYMKEDIDDTLADPQAIANEARVNADGHMDQMVPEDRQRATEFLTSEFPRKPRRGHFWYSDQFRGPTATLRRYGIVDVLDLYSVFSSATHAGFIGMRVFRDEPDLQDVNPRKDSRATGFALVVSSRLLVEGTRARVAFERVQDDGYEAVKRMILSLRPVE